MTLEEYASLMGIRLVAAGSLPTTDFCDEGPVGGACDIMHRKVECGKLKPHQILHEVMHVVLAVPFVYLEQQPSEEEFLMPIERAYGEALLTPEGYREVVEWQEITRVERQDKWSDLGAIRKYEQTRWWRRGLRMGRDLGLLDADNQATFKRPDWNKLPPRDRKYLCGWMIDHWRLLGREKRDDGTRRVGLRVHLQGPLAQQGPVLHGIRHQDRGAPVA